jgi:hypothetical protein
MTDLRFLIKIAAALVVILLIYAIGYGVVRFAYLHETQMRKNGVILITPEFSTRLRSSKWNEYIFYHLYKPASVIDYAFGGQNMYLDDYSDAPSGKSYIDF